MKSVCLILLIWLCIHSKAQSSSNTANLNAKSVSKLPSVVVTGSSQLAHTNIETMFSSEETWRQLEETGSNIVLLSNKSLFFRALAAGIFVGFGGILTTSVGFDMGSPPWIAGNGLARFMSGAVGFPLTILLVTMSGNGAWTGDALLAAVSCVKGTSSVMSVLRLLLVTYIGCFFGAFLMAILATVAKLPMIGPCIELSEHKIGFNFIETLFRGIGGGCLICMAIYMSKASRTMSGKVLGIWFPISTYVICDFEHCLGTMFFLLTAKLNGATFPMMDFVKTIIPSTLGNLLGGACLVGAGLANVPRKLSSNPNRLLSMKKKVDA